MTVPHAVAIYARISEDRDGDMLGVKRQLQDCRAHAEARGWPVVDTYIDDDVSAYRGKPRPEYRRMLGDIGAGRVDGVVVWHLDRLHRDPKELEEFFEVCERAGVRHLASVTGDVDLSTHDGQFLARILGAVARKESDDKSRRTKRKHLELAQAGRCAGGRRAYGYDADRRVVPEEAEVIRETARRLLAGESVRTLAGELDARGVPTARGSLQWSRHSLREILMSHRIAGVRSLRGEVVGPGLWDAIISAEESARLRALLNDPARRVTRPARNYLLKGFLHCGLCDAKLVARPSRGRRAYVCATGPGQHGCGGISIMAEPLEEFVVEAVLYRLDTPALTHALSRHRPERSDADDTVAAISVDETQLAELAAAYAARSVSMAEWLVARRAIEDRLGQLRASLVRRDRRDTLRDVAGHGAELRSRWPEMNLDQRRVVVGAVLDRVVVARARTHGRNRVDTERLAPTWKV